MSASVIPVEIPFQESSIRLTIDGVTLAMESLDDAMEVYDWGFEVLVRRMRRVDIRMAARRRKSRRGWR